MTKIEFLLIYSDPVLNSNLNALFDQNCQLYNVNYYFIMFSVYFPLRIQHILNVCQKNSTEINIFPLNQDYFPT